MTNCISTGCPTGGGDGSTRIYNEKPTGDNNCVNLTYQSSNVFDPASLIIRLDGITLDPDQYSIDADNQTFTLIVDNNDIKALHSPLDSHECLRIDYNIPATGSVASNDCISILN
jgi:hypothetical protein